MVRRADGDHPRGVARRPDAAVLRLALRVLPQVAGGRYDDEAGVDGALRRERQRIGRVRLVHAGGDGKIDHAEVECVLVRDRVIDRGDDVADVALAGGVEHFLDEQRRARSDAAAAAPRVVAAARDDAGDVRAVAVVVVRGGLEADEVDEPHDAIAAEIVVPVGDTGVDNRNADAGAVESERLLHPRRADRRARSLECGLYAAIETHAGHARHAGERVERGVGHVGDQAAHGDQTAAGGAPHAADRAFDVGAGCQAQDDARMSERHVRAPLQLAIERRACRPVPPRGRKGHRTARRQQRRQNEKPSGHESQGVPPSRGPRRRKSLWACKGAAGKCESVSEK